MRLAIKGTLLSGLIFPGIGQFSLGQVRRGWVFLITALTCLGVIVNEVINQVNASLANLDASQLNDPSSLLRQLESSQASTRYSLAMLVLAACWLWSIVDAYMIGQRLDRQN